MKSVSDVKFKALFSSTKIHSFPYIFIMCLNNLFYSLMFVPKINLVHMIMFNLYSIIIITTNNYIKALVQMLFRELYALSLYFMFFAKLLFSYVLIIHKTHIFVSQIITLLLSFITFMLFNT